MTETIERDLQVPAIQLRVIIAGSVLLVRKTSSKQLIAVLHDDPAATGKHQHHHPEVGWVNAQGKVVWKKPVRRRRVTLSWKGQPTTGPTFSWPGSSVKKKLPDSPGDGADTGWIADLKPFHNGTAKVAKKVLDGKDNPNDRVNFPQNVLAQLVLDHGELATCSLVQYECGQTDKVVRLTSIGRAAAEAVVVTANLPGSLSEVTIKATELEGTTNWETAIPVHSEQGSRYVTLFVLNLPPKSTPSPLAAHFNHHGQLLQDPEGSGIPTVDCAKTRDTTVQPPCHAVIKQYLADHLSKRYSIKRLNYPFGLDNRPICPVAFADEP